MPGAAWHSAGQVLAKVPRGGLRVRLQVASAYKYPRGFGCVPPRAGVVPATNDVKRGTLGCDVDAVSSGSWHRGESPYATPPPVVPEGLQVPGQVPARSSAGHVQVRF